jgi:uncharacterized membrane protein
MKPTLVFAAALFVVLGATIALHYSGMVTGPIDLDKFVGYLATLITVFGFTIGCYFGILAVAAYGHIHQIEKAAVQSEKFMEVMRKSIGEVETRSVAFTSYISQASVIISEFITAVGSDGANEYIDRLHVIQRRFEFSDAKDDLTKIRLARDLIVLGDRGDLQMVKAFLETRNGQDARELLLETVKRLGDTVAK